MDTAEHRVKMHTIAAERRNAGKPVWQYTVRGFKDALRLYQVGDDDTLIESRDATVSALKHSPWYEQSPPFGGLHEVVDELSDVGNPDIDWDDDYDPEQHFNSCLERIYDLADHDRAWLGI